MLIISAVATSHVVAAVKTEAAQNTPWMNRQVLIFGYIGEQVVERGLGL